MPSNLNSDQESATIDPGEMSYRSGAAARLAGLAVETLRVWERRYDLSETRRSAHGQRLYTALQVQRLGLLKQLVDQGHPIGQLARLSMDELRTLGGGHLADTSAPPRSIGVVAIGPGLACRIAASPYETLPLKILDSCAQLATPSFPRPGTQADVLLVALPEFDEAAIPAIAAAAAGAQAAATVVLYRFCSSATIRAVRAQGWLIARLPSNMGELVPLCRQALAGQHLSPSPVLQDPPSPRFDEETLARLTTASSRLACECPRHMSELLLMLGSFERYSAQCASRDITDAQLHRELGVAAGQARAILETALERLARAEGIPLFP